MTIRTSTYRNIKIVPKGGYFTNQWRGYEVKLPPVFANTQELKGRPL